MAGKYVIEATMAGAGAWLPAASFFPCSIENPSRAAAESELEVRREQAKFRRLELRVRCLAPDEREAGLERAARAPGADGKGPVTLSPILARQAARPKKAGPR